MNRVGGVMSTHFTLDGDAYLVDDFSEIGKELIVRLIFIDAHIKQLKNNIAVFNKAKNSYIEDLKFEAIEEKSGIRISDLFDEV